MLEQLNNAIQNKNLAAFNIAWDGASYEHRNAALQVIIRSALARAAALATLNYESYRWSSLPAQTDFFSWAAANGHLEEVKKLLRSATDEQKTAMLTAYNYGALRWAAENNHFEMMRTLLAYCNTINFDTYDKALGVIIYYWTVNLRRDDAAGIINQNRIDEIQDEMRTEIVAEMVPALTEVGMINDLIGIVAPYVSVGSSFGDPVAPQAQRPMPAATIFGITYKQAAYACLAAVTGVALYYSAPLMSTALTTVVTALSGMPSIINNAIHNYFESTNINQAQEMFRA
jgi:hypothetical protein